MEDYLLWIRKIKNREACHLLKEYMLFTAKIRENRKTMELRDAVNKAVGAYGEK